MGLFRSRKSQLRTEVDRLRADIANLSSSVRSISRSSTGYGSSLPSLSGVSQMLPSLSSLWPSRRSSWTGQAYDRLGDARHVAYQGADVVSHHLDRALDGASRQMRSRPLTALVALLGIGVAVGMLAKGSQSN
jgi:hypothetical protein